MTRVTRNLVLLGCPIRSELVTRFDRLVFDFIWGKYGDRFKPLSQHVEFGLEPLEQVLASFAAHWQSQRRKTGWSRCRLSWWRRRPDRCRGAMRMSPVWRCCRPVRNDSRAN